MSKVSIQGDASGTGTLTIAAPNTNSNYTLTLPTNTGTVMTSASDTFSGGLTLGGDLTLDSNGIYIGGTGAANYLDDYEEGTFTPTLDFTSSTGSLNYTQNTFRYIKIGSMVFISGYMAWNQNNFSASSGSLALKNLPFAASSTGDYRGGVSITYSSSPWTGLTIYQQAFRVEQGQTILVFNFSNGTNGSVKFINPVGVETEEKSTLPCK